MKNSTPPAPPLDKARGVHTPSKSIPVRFIFQVIRLFTALSVAIKLQSDTEHGITVNCSNEMSLKAWKVRKSLSGKLLLNLPRLSGTINY